MSSLRTVIRLVLASCIVAPVLGAPAPSRGRCRISDMDFSKVGSVTFPIGDTIWQFSVCTPVAELCPTLAAGYASTNSCSGGNESIYAEVSTFKILTDPADGIEYTFTNNKSGYVSASIRCDPNGLEDMVTFNSSSADGSYFSFTSKCACAGGCGAPSAALVDPECTMQDRDLTSVETLSFSTPDGNLWMLSPCGVAGAICPDTPGYLTAQASDSTCNKNSVYDERIATSAIPAGASASGGIVMVFRSDSALGDGSASVVIKCDPTMDMYKIAADPNNPLSTGYGTNSRLQMNFTSKCACVNGCPRARDYWVMGPGQNSASGDPLDYPAGYPGRTKGENGSNTYIGTGLIAIQCQQACDAVSGGKCVAFSYSQSTNGACSLWSEINCTTYSTPGWNWTTSFLSDSQCPNPRTHAVTATTGVAPTSDKLFTSSRNRRSAGHNNQIPLLFACPTKPGFCYNGPAIGAINSVNDSATCCSICMADPMCFAFTFLVNESNCVLRKSAGNSTKDPSCQSGTSAPPGPAPPPGPPTPPPSPPPWKPDNCSVGGMHFGALPSLKFSLPMSSTPNVDFEWELSLCKPQVECGGDLVYLLRREDGNPICLPNKSQTFAKLENFSAGYDGADFLYSSPSFGLASVSVACDPNAFLEWVVNPDPRFEFAMVNGSAAHSLLSIKLKSRCACPGKCGPLPTVESRSGCHIDGKNFSGIEPAVFELPANLTDGFSMGVPFDAPAGLRGEQMYTFSVSPCGASSTLCHEPSYVQHRPANFSWCNGDVNIGSELIYASAKHNVVEYLFAEKDNSFKSNIVIRCDPTALSGVLQIDPTMSEVVVSGARTKELTYHINLTSKCACDGECIPHPTRPYHSFGEGLAAINPGYPVDYPPGFPGRSSFNGTSCGRNIELNDCKRACDAAADPQCTSFEYQEGVGFCFLYQNGGCPTYSKDQTTTYWDSAHCPSPSNHRL